MEFFETIENRHSVRTFTDAPVADDTLEKLLRAALTAPSSKNCHSTSFLVLKNRETLARIAQMREMGSALIAGAQVAVIVCGDDSISDTWVDNASIAATLLQLAVVAEGLGSCWVHINGRPHRTGSEMSASDYLKTFIPIPENLSPLCVVAIGHPTPDYKFVPHKELYSEKVIEL